MHMRRKGVQAKKVEKGGARVYVYDAAV